MSDKNRSERTNEELVGQTSRFINTLAQCRELNVSVVAARENELLLMLPYDEKLIGNHETRVIHGGAITTLMDTASGSCIICALDDFELCPTLDLRVDYMRAAAPDKPVYARAYTYRITPNLIFTRCQAFQVKSGDHPDGNKDNESRVAHCVATFMRIGKENTPAFFAELVKGEVQ